MLQTKAEVAARKGKIQKMSTEGGPTSMALDHIFPSKNDRMCSQVLDQNCHSIVGQRECRKKKQPIHFYNQDYSLRSCR